jgi:hypothetical protein
LIVDAQSVVEHRAALNQMFFRLWRKWDRRFFKAGDGKEPSLTFLDDISRLEIATARGDVEELFSANLDVLIDFAHAGKVPTLAAAARFGAWFFPENDCERGSDGYAPALLHAMLKQAPAFELALMARPFPAGGIARLSAFHAATDPVSLARAELACGRRKPRCIMRTLSLLHQSGCDWKAVSCGQSATVSADPPPGSFEIARFLVRSCARALWSKTRYKLRREQWMIGIRRRGADHRQDFLPLVPPPDRFYADPFLIEKNGKSYLFVEELPFRTNKGIISFLEVSGDGRCSPLRPALEMEHHLSYPFVFEWRGQMYMLPETRDSGKICLFRALDFPCSWSLERVLMENVWAVDPTLIEYAGKWWLFAGGVEKYGDINSELYLFFAESPFGPWTPHPLNPVVSDVRRARPAGKLFVRDGYLVRPSQDCSLRYGAAVVLNRVTTMSETKYQEEPLGKLSNRWLADNLGSHTFNSSEHFEVIDGRRLIRRPFLRAR